MSGYCCECGELMDNYPIGHYAFGCHCVVLAVRKIEAQARSDAEEVQRLWRGRVLCPAPQRPRRRAKRRLCLRQQVAGVA